MAALWLCQKLPDWRGNFPANSKRGKIMKLSKEMQSAVSLVGLVQKRLEADGTFQSLLEVANQAAKSRANMRKVLGLPGVASAMVTEADAMDITPAKEAKVN
jgi:hypothetical protein